MKLTRRGMLASAWRSGGLALAAPLARRARRPTRSRSARRSTSPAPVLARRADARTAPSSRPKEINAAGGVLGQQIELVDLRHQERSDRDLRPSAAS